MRDTSVDDVEIKEGDYLSIVDGKIKASEKDTGSAVMAALERMVDEESGTISLFSGANITEDDAEALCEKIEELYPDCDVMHTVGAQPVYHYLISVE